MARKRLFWALPIVAALLFVVSSTAVARSPTDVASESSHWAQGAVFTMTNAPNGNSVWAYVVGPGGSLVPDGHFATHGRGTGVSLADSGSLALTSNHQWLLVINAGSNSLTVFHVNAPGGSQPLLTFTDRVSSHGTLPVSIAVSGDLVYVLNAGTSSVPGNIYGLILADHGLLFPLPGSSRSLSTQASTAPAEIAFTPSGTVLVVTEKNTSDFDTYTVGPRGYASGPTVTPSNGATPYGFAFGRGGSLIVSDAGPGALSSYAVARTGAVTRVSGPVTDGQTAACWIATVDGGRIAYTSNAHSATISTYHVAAGGKLTLLAGVAASTGSGDTDMAIGGSHGQYLFVYDSGAAEIESFSIGRAASLTLGYAAFALPSTAEGLVAF
ncbi:MAG: lactonase family protein [Thermoplasmata archaeon]|nr:lactonase family protein [Thermoplasmata archaeon]MCI4342382.1 lactonase family protein [Thermoplasmata archaeon]